MRCVFSSFAQLHSKRTVHPGVKIFHIEENLPEEDVRDKYAFWYNYFLVSFVIDFTEVNIIDWQNL